MRIIRRLRSEAPTVGVPAQDMKQLLAAPVVDKRSDPVYVPPKAVEAKRRVLNAGSGPASINRLHSSFDRAEWDEVRLDIDAQVRPDLVGSVADLRNIVGDATFDAIWSSHNVEHLYAHEVLPSFREFHRILKPTGYALVTCPDIAAIARLALENGLDHQAYISRAGPVTVLDMLFGFSRSIAQGNFNMAHHTGFTTERLGQMLHDAGFEEVRVVEGRALDLWAVACMPLVDRLALGRALARSAEAGLFVWS